MLDKKTKTALSSFLENEKEDDKTVEKNKKESPEKEKKSVKKEGKVIDKPLILEDGRQLLI